jgi:mono/diheme cytochrome c family protein
MSQIEVQQHRSPLRWFVLHPRRLQFVPALVLARDVVLVLQRLLLLSVSSSLFADEQVNYSTQIKPVLIERCVACHGGLKQEGGLRLDTAAFAIKGGESGAAVVPGDAAASSLLKRVTATDESERMPPEGEPLKPDQITALRNWIAQKAEAPADEQAQRDPREHWAFQAPVRTAVPQIENPSAEQACWQLNPIDGFISIEHRKRGLVPQPEADKRVWLRRVSLDLTGLPPRSEELAAFLADETPEAYDTVVTRLLDSQQYGQRWGRHWMDIWRYSDWWGLGAEVRNSQKHIWHWRDWIVESMNSDKGYDQMLREMLAADELYPNDLDRLRATGYLARQYFIFNRTSWMDETIEHTAKAMLGLTFNCAKCHDHKYDPFSQVEYYRMRAVFEPYQIRTEMVPGELDFEKDGIPRVFDAHLDVLTHLHVRGDDQNADKSGTMEPAVPAFLSSDELKLEIHPVSLPTEAVHPGLRKSVVTTHRQAAEQQITAARATVQAARDKLIEIELAAKERAAKKLAEKELAAKAGPATDEASGVIVRDDFASANPDVWEQLSGEWKYENGRLVQSQTGATRAAVRLKRQPPTDFEARLKYIPTGGEMWKSVGISYDVTAKGNEFQGYVSAYAAGPKAQITFKQGDAYVYPPTATQARKVELNQPHEIVLKVRGTLLNMSVDGEHSIAFRLPDNLKRQQGFLELIAFDATVEFVLFELKPLSTEEQLVDATPWSANSKGTVALISIEQAQLAVTVAEKAVQTAEALLASIDARAAADRARYLGANPEAVPSENTAATDTPAAQAATVAAKSERILAAARADEELSRMELALLQAAADKKAEAEQKIGAAKTAFETARSAIDTPSSEYTPLPGAKKTQEDYQNRNAGTPFPTTSTGRRSAVAKWLTDPRHPLPARVAVNHIWMRHMGRPLVPTVFDFGRNGTPPTHPELLDWLAVEFVEHDWSMKHLHRLIVTSQAYRQSSSNAGAPDTNVVVDRDNQFYWRMNPVRMEAQIVRDSLLHLAGELDVSLGGPSIPANDEASRRRSMYYVHSHNDHQKFLSMFDDANVLDCYRRVQSIVPQQALALENSPLATAMAGKIAERIAAKSPSASNAEFIRDAFVTILTVEPTAEETATMSELLQRMTELARTNNRPNPENVARTNLVQTLLNHNDFITIR